MSLSPRQLKSVSLVKAVPSTLPSTLQAGCEYVFAIEVAGVPCSLTVDTTTSTRRMTLENGQARLGWVQNRSGKWHRDNA